MSKAIAFFDANNFYHNVKDLIKPSDIDVVKLSEFICKLKGFELVDIFWYASVPDVTEKDYWKHISFLDHLKRNGINVIIRKLQKVSNSKTLKERGNKINLLDLCVKCNILIRNSFLKLPKFKKSEKGVDVWCAVDMIDKSCIENLCDVCILFSGDADFVPALNLIRKKGSYCC